MEQEPGKKAEGVMTLKVAATSNPATVAGAIANNVREGRAVELVAMGPNSVNQSVKALAIAQEYLREDFIALACRPEFMHLTIAGQEKSAIKLVVLTKPA
ncbi:MAG TPA: stage V sporulation protein S [bacterium]|jgi:stage V sporulation protein S|nr:stage V sporulation protein S [bacterium]